MHNKQFQLIIKLLAHLDNKISMLQSTINVGLQEQLENRISDIESQYASEVLDSQKVYDEARKVLGLD